MTEIWKDIPGYEGIYQVSSLGKVKSIKRFGTKGGIMHPAISKKGYLYLFLRKNNKAYYNAVHRLVAITFIPNPNNLPQVNHKDEDKTNNSVFINPDGSVNPEKSNLEWCDNTYNCHYGTHLERIRKANTNGKKSKPVLQYSLEGEFVKEYPSTREAGRQTGYSSGHIIDYCNGKRKTAYGYIWKYKNGS